MDTIQALKENKEAFGLMSAEMQTKAREIGIRNFALFGENCDCGYSWLAWCAEEEGDFYGSHTYQLVSGYTPEPEIERCEVKNQEGDLCWFNDSTNTWWALEQATHYPDFVGYEYEDDFVSSMPRMYRRRGKDTMMFYGTEEDRLEDFDVLTPTHVLFKKG